MMSNELITLRATLLALLVVLPASAGLAASDRALWDCADGSCTERAAIAVTTLEGRFEHGARIDPATEVDRIAALEQQRLREFAFSAREPARIYARSRLDRDYVPQNWPNDIDLGNDTVEVLMWVSRDGQIYERIGQGAQLRPGDVLLIGVRQQTHSTGGGLVTYYPARWFVDVSQRRTRPDADWQSDPRAPMPPLATSGGTSTPAAAPRDPKVAIDTTAMDAIVGSALKCGAEDCLEPGNQAPILQGDDTPGQGAAMSTSGNATDDLAVELQSELARVGCYQEEIDGLWGPASRRAMRNFNRWSGSELNPEVPSAKALVALARTPGPVCGVD